MQNNINFGLDLSKQEKDSKVETNYKFGAVEKEVLMPDGDWTKLTPECEIQKGNTDDWMDCVTESAINCISMILQQKFNIKENWSQRFTAKMSGTTRDGNSLYAVANAIRNYGIVMEVDWPRNRMMNWLEYYQIPTTAVKKKGEKWVIEFDVNYESVPTNRAALDKAQEFGPLQVIGYAWASEDGIYKDYGYRPNHAFVRAKKSEPTTFLQTAIDSYPTDFIIDDNSDKQEFIKILAADYKFGDALLYSIKLKATDKKSWLYKIFDMLNKIVRGTNGSLWFVKNGMKQQLTTWLHLAGALIDEFGCKTLKDEELNKLTDTKFFG